MDRLLYDRFTHTSSPMLSPILYSRGASVSLVLDRKREDCQKPASDNRSARATARLFAKRSQRLRRAERPIGGGRGRENSVL